MINNYGGYCSCRVKTRRWPMAFFINCLDIAAVNALVIWLYKEPTWNARKTNKHCQFLRELGMQLIRPQMERRSKQAGLDSHIQQTLSTNLGNR